MSYIKIKIIYMVLQTFGFSVRIIARLFVKGEWASLNSLIKSKFDYFNLKAGEKPSKILTEALIIGEDHRFFYHRGVDPIAMMRAIWKRTVYSKKEGGSTIEQQLIRVISGRFERTLTRKVKEIFFASLLHNCLTKIEIANLYLHIAYYGWKMNGLPNACQRLNISPRTENIYEAANIVARLKYPEPQICSSHRLSKIKHRTIYVIEKYNKLKKLYIIERQ